MQLCANILKDCGRAAQTSTTTLLINVTEVMLLLALRASADVAVIIVRWPKLVQPASLRLARRLADCGVLVFRKLVKEAPQTTAYLESHLWYTHVSIQLLGAVKTLNPCQRAEATKLSVTRTLPRYDNGGSNHLRLDNRAHTFSLTLCPKTSPPLSIHLSPTQVLQTDRVLPDPSIVLPTRVKLTHSEEAFSHKDRVTCKY